MKKVVKLNEFFSVSPLFYTYLIAGMRLVAPGRRPGDPQRPEVVHFYRTAER